MVPAWAQRRRRARRAGHHGGRRSRSCGHREYVVITLRRGAAAYTADRLSALTGSSGIETVLPERNHQCRPHPLDPFVLAGFFGGLALLTVVHVMLTSVQNRRKDLAILRSIGADRGWIARAVHWQATTFTLLPVASEYHWG